MRRLKGIISGQIRFIKKFYPRGVNNLAADVPSIPTVASHQNRRDLGRICDVSVSLGATFISSSTPAPHLYHT